MTTIIDFIIHIDEHIADFVTQYGALTYGILFAIIFCETGLVVTPFLPGDSLLFAAGMTAAATNGGLDPFLLFFLLSVAAVAGNIVNYHIGRKFGEAVLKQKMQAYLEKTHDFYEKYGAATLVLARFMPFIRTFAPFVAGASKMTYGKFMLYNLIGGVLWVATFVFLGYLFGDIPVVKENFSLVTILILVVTSAPPLVALARQFLKGRKARS
jgi:membrane-associated protein